MMPLTLEKTLPDPDWYVSPGLTDYAVAEQAMQTRVAVIKTGEASERIWLLQHPPLYTAGTSADAEDLKAPERFPVYRTGRGGQYTYHGPGQRIAYVMLDLNQHGRDLRRYIRTLEEWIIQTLAVFHINGERRDGRVGVWVETQGTEKKIAAIGVRVRHWVSFHGLAINVDPDLEHFSGIVPCGIRGFGVTSLADLGIPVAMEEVDAALRATCPFLRQPAP